MLVVLEREERADGKLVVGNRLGKPVLALAVLVLGTALTALLGCEFLSIRCDRAADTCVIVTTDALHGREERSLPLSEVVEVLPTFFEVDMGPSESVTVTNWELHTQGGKTLTIRKRKLADYASADLTQPFNKYLRSTESAFTWRTFYMGTPGFILIFLIPSTLVAVVVGLRKTRLTVRADGFTLAESWIPKSTHRTGSLQDVTALEVSEGAAALAVLALGDDRVSLGKIAPEAADALEAALGTQRVKLEAMPAPSSSLAPLLRSCAVVGCAGGLVLASFVAAFVALT